MPMSTFASTGATPAIEPSRSRKVVTWKANSHGLFILPVAVNRERTLYKCEEGEQWRRRKQQALRG